MMKRGIVLLALLMLCLLTACGSKNTLKADSLIRDNTGIDPDSFVYLDAGVWPENEYTEELPVPPGTVNTAYIDTTNEFCVVMLNEVSDADFDNYIAELENNKSLRAHYILMAQPVSVCLWLMAHLECISLLLKKVKNK